MKLGVDTAPLIAYPSGIPVVARQIFQGILRQRPDWDVSGFSWRGWFDARSLELENSRDPGKDKQDWRYGARLSSLALSIPFVSPARQLARRTRFETAKRPALDIFYALGFVPPGKIDCKVVPLVHDLFHLIEPSQIHPTRRRALETLPAILKQAPRIQCVSRSTADDVTRLLAVPSRQIDIVYPGVRPEFFAPARRQDVLELGLRPRSYWLAVGMGESRKNLGLLIDVFQRSPGLCSPDRPLVIVGAPQWQRRPYQAQLDQLKQDGSVRELGFVPNATLAALYADATAFLMPTLYEGFGIPLAEALAAGAPCICSDNSSLPEVSGGHALHRNPRDVDGWEQAMLELVHEGADPATVDAGRRHVQQFSEESTARSAIRSLEAA